jgi:hypothetical protein
MKVTNCVKALFLLSVACLACASAVIAASRAVVKVVRASSRFCGRTGGAGNTGGTPSCPVRPVTIAWAKVTTSGSLFGKFAMMALLPTGSVSLYALTADRCFLYSSESRRTVRQAVTAFPQSRRSCEGSHPQGVRQGVATTPCIGKTGKQLKEIFKKTVTEFLIHRFRRLAQMQTDLSLFPSVRIGVIYG